MQIAFAPSFPSQKEHSEAQNFGCSPTDRQSPDSRFEINTFFLLLLLVPNFILKLLGGQNIPSKCTDAI
jgi:hypothetical protein